MQEGAAALDLRRRVQVLFTTGSAIGLSDRDLLERFLYQERESAEAAFSALVERHGPMVLRVCTQALGDRHAADDAFQATFMVLLQHARSIRKHDSMESWLFGVACRAAARIRMLEARRKRYELRRASLKPFDEANFSESPDLWSELHAGIARLPEKHRIPIVLCYFEGLTHEQAAARLGWPVGTVKTRLSRARDQLRWRLRGRAWGTKDIVPIEHLRPPDLVGVPRYLLDATTRVAARFLSGTGAGLVNSSSVLATARGVSRAMLLSKLSFASVPLFGGLALGLAAIAVARQAPEKGQVLELPAAKSTPALDSPQPGVLKLFGTTDFPPERVLDVRAPFEGRVENVFVDLGSGIKNGDPLLEFFSADLADAKSEYEIASSQYEHDKKVIDLQKELAARNPVKKAHSEVQDDEPQSRLKLKVAKDKLLVYGLSEKEIENIKSEDGVQKAKMILRSRRDGIVYRRSVVRGNYYSSNDVLLAIAGNDVLRIAATANARDSDKLQIGQSVKVDFPFNQKSVNAKVEAISPPDGSGKVTIKTTIPNPDRRFKPGMFVRLGVDLGPGAHLAKQGNRLEHPQSALTLDERLSLVEQKIDRLLGENERQDPNAAVLKRLTGAWNESSIQVP